MIKRLVVFGTVFFSLIISGGGLCRSHQPIGSETDGQVKSSPNILIRLAQRMLAPNFMRHNSKARAQSLSGKAGQVRSKVP